MTPKHRHRGRGFTLVELAVVMTVVALLLASLMYTLSAQTEQRSIEETRRRLEQARELVLAYVVANGRLPCPARCAGWPNCTTTSAEVRDGTGTCTDGTQDHYGGTLASGAVGGLLPAQTIGSQQVNIGGFAVDYWGNPIRYAVARTVGTCTGPLTPHWTHAGNMRTNGIGCQPTVISAANCGGAANQIMSQNTVVAIIFSTGKNGTTTGGTGTDEAANLNGGGNTDPIFVYHPPTPSDFVNGEFDDQFSWITAGELYGKLIAAGILP
jgi:prepilin-type N-terminal cleavage/methylation domain-containing protein